MLVTDLYCFGSENEIARLTTREIAATQASVLRCFHSNMARTAQCGCWPWCIRSSRSRMAITESGVIVSSLESCFAPTEHMKALCVVRVWEASDLKSENHWDPHKKRRELGLGN